MISLPPYLKLIKVQEVVTSVVSMRQAHRWCDDLTDNRSDWLLAEELEHQTTASSQLPGRTVFSAPFDDAKNCQRQLTALMPWQSSRFSDGSFGVWYGSTTVDSAVMIATSQWIHILLWDAGFEGEAAVAERDIFYINCSAPLLNLDGVVEQGRNPPANTDRDSLLKFIGAETRRQGYPGLVTFSNSIVSGAVDIAVFSPDVLSNPMYVCSMTCHLNGDQVRVQRSDTTSESLYEWDRHRQELTVAPEQALGSSGGE